MTHTPAQHPSPGARQSQRLDKWLWYARIVKTRSLATTLVGRGKVRVNSQRTIKPSLPLRPGDVVTATVAKRILILKVLATGGRRGPATEAQRLYEDLTPAAIPAKHLAPTGTAGRPPNSRSSVWGRLQGAGRPTKRDRRLIDRLQNRNSDG